MNETTQYTDAPRFDTSGFRVFSEGELGAMHAMAHELLDRDEPAQGYRVLGDWLRGRTGSGSRWLHLQWHQLVFEIAVGDLSAARDRYERHLLGASANTEHVLTDAPAALWRLALAGAEPPPHHWQTAARTAANALSHIDDRYVTLHNLLALAGARELATLDRWLAGHRAVTRADEILARMALGLRCFAAHDYASAAAMFAAAVPELGGLGGSRAQNDLFANLARVAKARAASDNHSITLH